MAIRALCAVLVLGAVSIAAVQAVGQSGPWPSLADVPISGAEEPITPVPQPPVVNAAKLALGEQLFNDPRLSRDSRRSCSSCHDLSRNGTTQGQSMAVDPSDPQLDVPTLFNAALSFRLNWEGDFRSLESQAEASFHSQKVMGQSVEDAAARLMADPPTFSRFQEVYGSGPTRENVLDALATFERSLLTPGSKFDRWLAGDRNALSDFEEQGYLTFKSLGCISCHQGVNVGGNLFQRHGIFMPLASRYPEVLRVPSLRNVATTAPYFHDGSAASLDQAVRRMGRSQLNLSLDDQQVASVVAFLNTLTGDYRGRPVRPLVDE